MALATVPKYRELIKTKQHAFIEKSHSTSTLYSPEVSVYELLYGDLTKMEHFFVLTNNSDSDSVHEENKKIRPISELLAKLEKINKRFPIEGIEDKDLNEIGLSISNMTTRRQRVGKASETHFYAYDLDDYYDDRRKVTEKMKKMRLCMINLQFLIHIRVKIKEARRIRRVVKLDKRYRLGYLFNRMRKLSVEQRKLATAAEENRLERTDLNRMYQIMRMYEQIVHYDVDVRDTEKLIISVYSEKASIDKLY